MSRCRCCGRGWLVALGALGAAYWWGRQLRPATRQSEIAAIDEPIIVDAWERISNWPQFRAMREMIAARVIDGRESLRVLDVGCGSGQLALLLAQRPEVTEVVGVDLSGSLIEHARQTAEESGSNARFYQVDAAEMPLPDGEFSVVVSTLSLHHWERPIDVLREIRRVLTPDGKAFIFDLRRDASPLLLGVTDVVRRTLVPRPLRETGEPIVSFQAAYTPCEAVLLAAKAGWTDPRVSTGPFWLVLENGEEA